MHSNSRCRKQSIATSFCYFQGWTLSQSQTTEPHRYTNTNTNTWWFYSCKGKAYILHCYISHFYIRRVSLTVSPRACDGRKCAIRMVEFVIVGTEEERGEGLLQRTKMRHQFNRSSNGKRQQFSHFLDMLTTTAWHACWKRNIIFQNRQLPTYSKYLH